MVLELAASPSPLPPTLFAAVAEVSGDRRPQGSSNGTGLAKVASKLTYPSGYYDSTNGNAFFWGCGCSNTSKPYGTRNNCAGGCYTGGTCACACQLNSCTDANNIVVNVAEMQAEIDQLKAALKCAGFEDKKTCKIKNCDDNAGTLTKCKKQCKKKKLNKKCKKTCCDADF